MQWWLFVHGSGDRRRLFAFFNLAISRKEPKPVFLPKFTNEQKSRQCLIFGVCCLLLATYLNWNLVDKCESDFGSILIPNSFEDKSFQIVTKIWKEDWPERGELDWNPWRVTKHFNHVLTTKRGWKKNSLAPLVIIAHLFYSNFSCDSPYHCKALNIVVLA